MRPGCAGKKSLKFYAINKYQYVTLHGVWQTPTRMIKAEMAGYD